MNRLLKISRRAGSAVAARRAVPPPPASSSSSSPPGRRCTRQPSSTTKVLCGSTISAGPASGAERRRGHQRHLAPGAEPGAGARRQRRIAAAGARHRPALRPRRGLACLDPQRFDDHLQRVGGEAEAAQVLGMEALAHLRECAGRYRAAYMSLSPARSSSRCATPTAAAARAVRAQLGARLRLAASAQAAARRRQARRIERARRRLARRTASQSATPMPKADSTLASGCTRMRRTPRRAPRGRHAGRRRRRSRTA